MKRYWDLTEKERAELTREQVEEFTRYELMERGVLAVEPLLLEPEPEVELPGKRVYYRPSTRDSRRYACDEWELCFESPEQVEAFLALMPIRIRSHWFGGTIVNAAQPWPADGGAFDVVHLAPEDAVQAAAKEYETLNAVRKRNVEAREAHEKATRAQREALSEMWDDWHRCQAKHARFGRIINTWREYQELAGDDTTARRFLGKVFSDAEVEDAAEWFGVEIPSAEPAQDAVEFESMGMKVAFAPGE